MTARMAFRPLDVDHLANLQNGLLLRDSGMIDDRTLDTVATHMMICVRSTGGRKWWRETSNAHPETRAYIESRLAHDEEQHASVETLLPFWMAMAPDGPNSE